MGLKKMEKRLDREYDYYEKIVINIEEFTGKINFYCKQVDFYGHFDNKKSVSFANKLVELEKELDGLNIKFNIAQDCIDRTKRKIDEYKKDEENKAMVAEWVKFI